MALKKRCQLIQVILQLYLRQLQWQLVQKILILLAFRDWLLRLLVLGKLCFLGVIL